MPPKVLLTRRLPEPVMQRLESETELHCVDLDRQPTRDELLAGIADVDGLICLLTDTIDDELLAAGRQLRVVSNYAVGFNNIDVDAATARNIAVTNTPGVLTECTADMAWALLMATARRIVEGDRLVRSGNWTGWEPLQLLGSEVTGATLGVVGMGRIGKAMAKRAAAFDMRVVYWNRTRLDPAEEQQLEIEYRPLERLWPECDYVSVHVALAEQTRHLIGANQLAQMKPTAALINTARGPVIDEAALVDALQGGQIARAGLDVYEDEPQVSAQLQELPNTVLAPHLGSATIQTRTRMGHVTVDNCLAACAGQCPPDLVNSDWQPES